MASADRTHVLLIAAGDDAMRRRLAGLLVQQPLFACNIAHASNGAAALEALRAARPDCMLLDSALPDMTSLEWLERASPEGNLPCAIVLIVAPGTETTARRAAGLGVRICLRRDEATEATLWRAIAGAISDCEQSRHANRRVPRGINASVKDEGATISDAALLSHQLRAPLQSILGNAELLRIQGPLTPRQDQQVTAMLQAGRHLLGLIEQSFAATAVPPAETAEPAPLESKRLLVVDDIAVNRDVIGAFLHAAGHQVTLAESGEEAIRLAFEQTFDLILMDVRMPDTDGLEATRRIRALPAPRGDVPILGVTAHAFIDQVAACRAAGMDGHIAKPVAYATLMAAISKAIARVPALWQTSDLTPPASEPVDPPRGLDRAVLDETLAFLRPDEIGTHLQTLRTRKEELIRLLDMPTDPALLTETAHSLASVAGMFGFTLLSVLARRFEHAMAHDAPDSEQLGRRLRTETRAALGTLDQLQREFQMQAA